MGRQDWETETLIPTGGFFDDAVTQYGDKAGALTASYDSSPCSDRGQNVVSFCDLYNQTVGVRRLTPTECERLQGFPDGHTLVEHRGKPAADGPRYKAIGNSMAVPVMRWIGRRIQLLESRRSIANQEA